MTYIGGKNHLLPFRTAHQHIGKVALVTDEYAEEYGYAGQIEYISNSGLYKINFCSNWIEWYELWQLKIMN